MHPLLAGRLGRRRHVIDATELAKKSLAGWKKEQAGLWPCHASPSSTALPLPVFAMVFKTDFFFAAAFLDVDFAAVLAPVPAAFFAPAFGAAFGAFLAAPLSDRAAGAGISPIASATMPTLTLTRKPLAEIVRMAGETLTQEVPEAETAAVAAGHPCGWS